MKKETNLIPEITHPLGRYWDQPDSDNFIFQKDRILIKEVDFNKLKEYFTSIPTGAYIGKMWKRHIITDFGEEWYLCWYGEHPEPGILSINTIKIKVVW